MKVARFVLKIVGGSLVLAGFVCLAIGYWDRMMGICAIGKVSERASEYDDYADEY